MSADAYPCGRFGVPQIGGCLKGELYQYAIDAMHSKEARVRYYDLMTEDDPWGQGIDYKGQPNVVIPHVRFCLEGDAHGKRVTTAKP